MSRNASQAEAFLEKNPEAMGSFFAANSFEPLSIQPSEYRTQEIIFSGGMPRQRQIEADVKTI